MLIIDHQTSNSSDNTYLHHCKEGHELHSIYERGISQRISWREQAGEVGWGAC